MKNNYRFYIFIAMFMSYTSWASALNYWEVSYSGVSQGSNFSRQGLIAIYPEQLTSETTNQPNPFELIFYSGNPAASPESGAIWFMTNNAFLGSASQIDLADVQVVPTKQGDGSCVIIRPDPSLSAIGANGFNALSGLTADMYQIFSGHMYFCSIDNFQTINGEIDILGTGALFHSNTEYHAIINGRYIGEQ